VTAALRISGLLLGRLHLRAVLPGIVVSAIAALACRPLRPARQEALPREPVIAGCRLYLEYVKQGE